MAAVGETVALQQWGSCAMGEPFSGTKRSYGISKQQIADNSGGGHCLRVGFDKCACAVC